MALDLGSILSTVGSAYVQARYAPPMNIVQQRPALFGWGDGAEALVDTFGNPAPTGNGACGAPVKCKGYTLNPMTGKWTKNRRRRRRLATKSDIKDLASLKGIVGTGEAFKVWIATHS